jgi:hypothetical protein
MSTKNGPVHEIRMGTVKATVWANELPGAGTVYTTTTTKLYKVGDTWKEGNSYSRDELLLLAEVCRAVFVFIVSQQGGVVEQRNEV